MKSRIIVIIIVALVFLPLVAGAKLSDQFKKDFESRYRPATPHQGLVTAAEPVEPSKVKTYMVAKIGNVLPAERAYYFISPVEYDYRGVEIKDGHVKTRMGTHYTTLPKGTIMILSGVVYSGNHVWLKLLSVEKIPSDRNEKLKPTRVTLMLGFKMPSSLSNGHDMQQVYSMIDEWAVPFGSYEEAKKYSSTLL